MVYDGFIEDYIEKLKKTLPGNQEAVSEFNKRIKEEKASPMDIALEIISRYSGDIHTFFGVPNLSSIETGYNGSLIGKVNSIRCTEFEKDGKKGKRCVGYLEDEKGKLPFTMFDPSYQYVKGDYLLIKDAKVGEFNGKPYLTLSNRNQIVLIEKSKNIDASNKLLKIKDLKPDMYSLSIKGRLRVTGSKDNVGRDKTTMYSGVLSDDTGTIGVRSWGIKLSDGEVEISNVSVRQYKDRLYINIGNGSQLKMISTQNEDIKSLEVLSTLERGNVRGTGIVTKIYSKNPIVQICSECGRIVKGGKCENHPDSIPKKILRLSIALDDGTLSPNVYIYQKNLLSLIKMKEEDVASLIENGDVSKVIREIENALMMKFVDFSLFGFRGKENYYMEIEELNILDDDEMSKRYSKIMEELE